MRPDPHANPAFIAAFGVLAARIAAALEGAPRELLPIKMFVAGGAAMHFYTGERVSSDIDAVFSRRLVLPDGLSVSYRDADGAARHLYFDTQYNDSFGLHHEDAQDDALLLELPTLDARIIEVRLLTPTDLAVSKIARFAEHDRTDIIALARRGLIKAPSMRKRALEALGGYVGNLASTRNSIEIACRVVAEYAPQLPARGRNKRKRSEQGVRSDR